jgi:uncharacterized protein (TIGR03085 family)
VHGETSKLPSVRLPAYLESISTLQAEETGLTLSRASLVTIHREERRALLDTLERVGDSAPTLCEPWTTSSIAAHIVDAERGAGIGWALGWPLRKALGPQLAPRVMNRLQQPMQTMIQRTQRKGWPWLLQRLASGPPILFRFRGLARIRLLEDWIHHEDIRRANGLASRPSNARLDQALLEALMTLALTPEFAQTRADIEVLDEYGHAIRPAAHPSTRVAGPIGEVALALAGRGRVADVTVDGHRDLLDGRLLRI